MRDAMTEKQMEGRSGTGRPTSDVSTERGC